MPLTAIARAYKGPGRLIGKYWSTYGGWKDFLVSPYFHGSLLLLLVTVGAWSKEKWWDQVFSVVPSLLGFSLGSLAIFLGFGSESFRNVISGKRADPSTGPSPYMSVTAAFTHFIVVQIAALVLSVCSAALYPIAAPAADSIFHLPNLVARWVLWGAGYWLFLYALCLAAASVFAVFRIASWFDEHRTRERSMELSGNAEATAPISNVSPASKDDS